MEQLLSGRSSILVMGTIPRMGSNQMRDTHTNQTLLSKEATAATNE